ncbi:MAG: hypothetical protein WC370_00060 [Dehalococcoidales bacterium]|jgi:molybdate transport system regulatory protein
MGKNRGPDFRRKQPSSRKGIEVRGTIWLEKDGRLYLDIKRATLLGLIDRLGSLAAAARSMGLSYNTAWLWVMAMNRLSPRPLVKKGSGGSSGGYSVLTAQGSRVIAEYSRLNSSLEETIDRLGGFKQGRKRGAPRNAVLDKLGVIDDMEIAADFG